MKGGTRETGGCANTRWTLCGVDMGDGRTPDGDANSQHDNSLRLSFRGSGARDRATPGDPLMQAPAPRAVGLSEPANIDGAPGPTRTGTSCETRF